MLGGGASGGGAAWMEMWGIAVFAFALLKGSSLATARGVSAASLGRRLAYLFLWPGMDAKRFCFSQRALRPRVGEWIRGAGNAALGAALIALATTMAETRPLLAGWIGMTGIVLTLHCGAFSLLASAWRAAGVEARPLMHAPLLASSLSEFWSVRWNCAFRDWAYAVVFRPVAARFGGSWGTATVFMASGIIHDAVISVPVGAGFGLPTLYFAIQAAGVLLERRMLGGRRPGEASTRRRLAAIVVVAAPAGLLFHEPFVRTAMVPMLIALRPGL